MFSLKGLSFEKVLQMNPQILLSELDIYLYTLCSPFHPQNLLGVWKTDGIWTGCNFLTKLFHQIFSLPPPLFSPALNPLRVKWAYLALSSNFTWFSKFTQNELCCSARSSSSHSSPAPWLHPQILLFFLYFCIFVFFYFTFHACSPDAIIPQNSRAADLFYHPARISHSHTALFHWYLPKSYLRW